MPPINNNRFIVASVQSRVFSAFLRLINKKGFLGRQLKSGRFNRFDCPEPPAVLFRKCTIKKYRLHGRNVFTLAPTAGHTPKTHILYLHGGAYVQCFALPHWHFLSELIKGTDCAITAPDYHLAPAHTYKEAFGMVEELYKQLIGTVGPDKLILMGDSAGGGFALALAQKMRNDHIAVPAQVILLSPWLDVSLENPLIDSLEPADPFLGKESLQQAGKLYAGSTGPHHYLVSPINGPLAGLGKITVFAGSNEILAADARKLQSKAVREGVALEYHEYPDMVHGWMFLNFPESKRTLQQIITLVRSTGVDK